MTLGSICYGHSGQERWCICGELLGTKASSGQVTATASCKASPPLGWVVPVLVVPETCNSNHSLQQFKGTSITISTPVGSQILPANLFQHGLLTGSCHILLQASTSMWSSKDYVCISALLWTHPSQSLQLMFTVEFQPVQYSSTEHSSNAWPPASPGTSPWLLSKCSQAQ